MHIIYMVEFHAEKIHRMKWFLNALLVETWSPPEYKQGDLGLKIYPTNIILWFII